MVNVEVIRTQLTNTVNETDFPELGKKYEGKVRDNYITEDGSRYIISTDRLSAFDRVLATIPFKGQLLNQMSTFWFEKTKNICDNHIIDVPDPNVVKVKECKTFPIEMILRNYLTGSAWRDYQKGKPISGIKLPEGLKKHEKIDLIITPSTKAPKGEHDLPISREEILAQGLVPEDQYKKLEEITLNLFKFGRDYCAKNNLILVDCKFEFGYIEEGDIILIDEIFTPDASRFWIKDTYQARFDAGEEPKILDKEFFRQWLIGQGYMGDGDPPKITEDVKVELCQRYIESFEMITGEEFKPDTSEDANARIKKNLGL